MAEKMTANGLVVGLIIEPKEEVPIKAEPKEEAPIGDKPKRGRPAKAE